MEQLDKKTMMYIGIAVVVVAVLAFLWCKRSKNTGTTAAAKGSDSAGGGGSKKPIIYGSMGCPYTVKQVEKYPDHEFVDCTGGKCPSFVTAYPTTKWPDGRVEVGFS
jgi:hypothetical protein